MQLSDSNVAEILGKSNFDWVAIDREHGSISRENLPNLMRAIELGNSLPLVRVPELSEVEIKISLDSGAAGIIIPKVESSDDVEKINNFSKWHPSGRRGGGFSRGNLFGKEFSNYHILAQSPILIGMIETKSAIDNIQEILQSGVLDAILIGPYDLSASLGITGELEDELFIESINLIKDKANQYNTAVGVHIVEPNKEKLYALVSEGYQFIPYSIDTVFLTNNAKCPKL